MLILGLVLIAAAVALGAGAVFDGSEAASVELLGTTVDTTVAGVFFAGAATMLLFMVGVLMLVSSMGRSRRRRQERKETKRRQRDSVQSLEKERAELRAENERLSGQLGNAREPERETTDASSTRASGTSAADRDGDGRADVTETRDGRPMRESDGTAGSRRADSEGVDLRDRERTAVRGDSTT